jgi:4,5-dihydroxyphthalate decarboxylase
MSASVSIALEPYDRHFPLLERTWRTTDGTCLRVELVGQLAEHPGGKFRHERFLRGREFDVAEMSLASYLMYRERNTDLVALPVFPRRLFSFSNVWVPVGSTATRWSDLRSGVIGVPAFQMSLGIVARRDMDVVEGVDWTDFTWATSHAEPVEFQSPATTLRSESFTAALECGEADAVLLPEIPPGPEFIQVARRLYGARSMEMELEQFQNGGYVPIVHVLVAQARVLERHPELGSDLVRIFSEVYDIAWNRYDDPAWGMNFWGRQGLERQRDAFGRAVWSHGLAANWQALSDFADAARRQGILAAAPDLSAIFHKES